MNNIDQSEYKVSGSFDFVKNGFISGWAATSADIIQTNLCNLWVDDYFVSSFEAVLYRDDLKAEAIRSGVVGFKQAIPFIFCDGQEHKLTLKTSNNRTIIQAIKLIPRNRNLVALNENIVFDQINKPYAAKQKLMFLAGFTNKKTLLNYQKHFVKSFQKAGYYVIYVLASDVPETLSEILTNADRIIIRRNEGYDFGSWATVFQLCQQEFIAAKEVIWANDSIIGPINSLEQLLKKINASSSDIWAITDSQDIKYHFQSFLWGLKKKAHQFYPLIDAFFFYRNALPRDKEEAINNFELEALSFFKEQDLTLDILFPEHILIKLSEEKFIAELKVYSEKWQPLFNLPLLKEEFHAINESVLHMANVFINQYPTNPSHAYWNALFESGFPFIKKELVTLNPLNYPFPYQFRATFEEHGSTALLDDLAGTFKSTKFINSNSDKK